MYGSKKSYFDLILKENIEDWLRKHFLTKYVLNVIIPAFFTQILHGKLYCNH